MHQRLTSHRFWLPILGASVLLGLAGPFGTYEALPLAARLAYWLAISVSTFLLADAVVAFLSTLRDGETRRGSALAFAIYGALAGVPVALAVAAINLLSYGRMTIGMLELSGYCVVITAIATVLMRMLFLHVEGADPVKAPEAGAPEASRRRERARLLDRLPLNQRGPLLYLSMQDHYVDVHTDKGGTLLLMRLADAITETEGVDGLQIHRSHWVAIAAVKGSSKDGGKLVLEMADGAELPVSRPYLQAVRDAGLV